MFARTAQAALSIALVGGVCATSSLTPASAQTKSSYSVAGTYVEGCSCGGPCPCQLTGVANGCTGLGVLVLTSGKYKGVDLSGVKIAYATTPGDWVRLYVDAREPQQQAASDFGKAVYSAFGKVEAVKPAQIQVSGQGGKYTVSVDGGKIMEYTTEPVLGGDKRTPIMISNIHDPLHPTVMQGKTLSGSYQDGDHSFTLKDSNSYFTDRMHSSGKL
jgi:hypothetical protein